MPLNLAVVLLAQGVSPAGSDIEVVVSAVKASIGGIRSINWCSVQGAVSSLSKLVLVSGVCVEEVCRLVGRCILSDCGVAVGLGLGLSEHTTDGWVVWASEEAVGEENTLLRGGDGGATDVGGQVKVWNRNGGNDDRSLVLENRTRDQR